MKDIYFNEKYGKLYEKSEGGKVHHWKYEGREGAISYQFIVREIPISLGDGKWFDIISPYGYGGPLIERIDTTKIELLNAYETEFGAFCEENRIVSEFVRFHPLFENGLDFQNIYHSQCIRHTVVTDLMDCDDPVESAFSKSCRKNIRQALKKGVTWRITRAPKNLDAFKEIYYATMDRNHAVEYYYFNDEYFENCLMFFPDDLLLIEALYDRQIIAAGLYFLSGRDIHVHLSGTLPEYLSLSPAYILRYAVCVWGKENGFERIHHGGGRTNDESDALYQFKKQFGTRTVAFYIGKRVWNPEVYEKLCDCSSKDKNSEFFPAYRSR